MSCPHLKNSVQKEEDFKSSVISYNEITDLLHKSDVKEGKCPLDEKEREKLSKNLKECPEFTKGCPFKEVNDIKEVESVMDKIPNTHLKCPAFQDKITLLKDQIANNQLAESILQRRWDLFFEEPLKYIELGKKLKQGTTQNHILAESVPFMKKFVKFEVEKTVYRRYLSNLYFIYEAIEEELEKNKNDSVLSKIYYPKELSRLNSLKKDLEYFYGKDFIKKIKPLNSTTKYVQRIHETAESKPYLLVSHSYTRYLGDLFGGQILKKIAKKALNLESNLGICFYDFDNIKDLKEFKNEFKNKLNYLPVTEIQSKEIVDEANLSFEMNIEMFIELEKKNEVDEGYQMCPDYQKSFFAKYQNYIIFLLLLLSIFYKSKNFFKQ
jgi:heme oxygenase (biliverdin-producing, ferredoxin)